MFIGIISPSPDLFLYFVLPISFSVSRTGISITAGDLLHLSEADNSKGGSYVSALRTSFVCEFFHDGWQRRKEQFDGEICNIEKRSITDLSLPHSSS
jgi:hypothetical protein